MGWFSIYIQTPRESAARIRAHKSEYYKFYRMKSQKRSPYKERSCNRGGMEGAWGRTCTLHTPGSNSTIGKFQDRTKGITRFLWVNVKTSCPVSAQKHVFDQNDASTPDQGLAQRGFVIHSGNPAPIRPAPETSVVMQHGHCPIRLPMRAWDSVHRPLSAPLYAVQSPPLSVRELPPGFVLRQFIPGDPEREPRSLPRLSQ